MLFNDPRSNPTAVSVLANGLLIFVFVYAVVVGLLAQRLANCGAACQTMIPLFR